MRRLTVQVPVATGTQTAHDLAQEGAQDVLVLDARSEEGSIALIIANVPNDRLDAAVAVLPEEAVASFAPAGQLTLRPPPGKVAHEVARVHHRSAIEVFLSGLQAVGSWTGFLSYATASGVLVWAAMAREMMILLIAAMLVSPLAGPVMDAAIAAARGDARLFGRSLARFLAGIGIGAAVAAGLAAAFAQATATTMMWTVTDLSLAAFLLPVAGGVAGAVNLVQSERDSLVSNAAVGMLVAVSLAPPAAVLGMAAVVGAPDLALRAAFLLALNLGGLVAVGAVVCSGYGLRPNGPRVARGQRAVSVAAVAAAFLLFAAAFAWQASNPEDLQRSSSARQAESRVVLALEEAGAVPLEVRATPAEGTHALLVVAYVRVPEGIDPDQLQDVAAAAGQGPLPAYVHVVRADP